MLSLNQLLEKAHGLHASDVHLVCGLPAKCRIDGAVTDLTDEVLTAQDCELYARALAGNVYETMSSIGELDLARSFPGIARTRVNLFRQQGCVSAAIRLLADHIPSLEELSLVVADFAAYRSGIVLVTGETGSGKSTTLAALLDRINHSRPGHIITLEDPIEYVYTPDRCIINQREIGADTRSYADGLRAILREDPDVILIGEMRDLNTIETALTAAETGHLVFATLHTNSAADAVDRMVNVFPPGRFVPAAAAQTGQLRAHRRLRDHGGHGRHPQPDPGGQDPPDRQLHHHGRPQRQHHHGPIPPPPGGGPHRVLRHRPVLRPRPGGLPGRRPPLLSPLPHPTPNRGDAP